MRQHGAGVLVAGAFCVWNERKDKSVEVAIIKATQEHEPLAKRLWNDVVTEHAGGDFVPAPVYYAPDEPPMPGLNFTVKGNG